MVVGGYKNVDAMNPQGGYQESSAITVQIFDHKNGHDVKPNRVVLKYPDLKKTANPYAHVRVFNFVVKANAKTSKKYIINAFNYMLRDTS
jgi:hypothetical protein